MFILSKPLYGRRVNLPWHNTFSKYIQINTLCPVFKIRSVQSPCLGSQFI